MTSNVSIPGLQSYLSKLHQQPVELTYAGALGEKIRKRKVKEIKGFGYGVPLLLEYRVSSKAHRAVLETVKPGPFGHEYQADRAHILVLAHCTYNLLPNHARCLGLGKMTHSGLHSIPNDGEYFVLTEYAAGEEYFRDLERLRARSRPSDLDVRRARCLATYLSRIHQKKIERPSLYTRRIRDLVGHGECIMGLVDSYPQEQPYFTPHALLTIEKKCVEWRHRLKKLCHRLSQVHGDFHPWNILFHSDTDFTVLDRSRGPWGEPADDVSALAVNYLFYSLQVNGELAQPYRQLWDAFIKQYLERTGDEEMLRVVQPFLAWRALVLASPVWYPSLGPAVRRKLFNFIKNILEEDAFEPKKANQYLQAP